MGPPLEDELMLSHLPMRRHEEMLRDHPYPHDHDVDFGRRDWAKGKAMHGEPGHPGVAIAGAPGTSTEAGSAIHPAPSEAVADDSGWYY